MGTKKTHHLTLDANILIDFCQCDKTIIKLICQYVGQIYLSTAVLGEVNAINEEDCLELGVILVEPELEQVMLAADNIGPLSFQDNLCLILAKERGWICITNDKPLRKRCEAEGLSVIWGIELICILVQSGGLPVEHGRDMILRIQKINPRYITDDIVERAFKMLSACPATNGPK